MLNKQFTFIPNTTINPDEVNANFDDIVNHINTQVAGLDAPAFTGIPTVPATDPSSPVHVTSKAYVDARVAASVPVFGTHTGSTDGFAHVTISHSLGRVPVGAIATINGNVGLFEMAAATVKVVAATANTVTFKVWNGTSPYLNNAVRLHWGVY